MFPSKHRPGASESISLIGTEYQNEIPHGISVPDCPGDILGVSSGSSNCGSIESFTTSAPGTWQSTPDELFNDDLELQSPFLDLNQKLQSSNYLNHRPGTPHFFMLDGSDSGASYLFAAPSYALTDVIPTLDCDCVPHGSSFSLMKTTEPSVHGFFESSTVGNIYSLGDHVSASQDSFLDDQFRFPVSDFLPDWTSAGQLQYEEPCLHDKADENTGTLIEDSDFWICPTDGCSKRFNQRHKYK